MVINICSICKQEFVSTRRKIHLCSQKCINIYLSIIRTGINNPMYGDGSSGRQYRKYGIGKINCELCNKHLKLEVHHKDGNTRNFALVNLVRVCRRCHMFIDGRFKNLTFGHENGVNPTPPNKGER